MVVESINNVESVDNTNELEQALSSQSEQMADLAAKAMEQMDDFEEMTEAEIIDARTNVQIMLGNFADLAHFDNQSGTFQRLLNQLSNDPKFNPAESLPFDYKKAPKPLKDLIKSLDPRFNKDAAYRVMRATIELNSCIEGALRELSEYEKNPKGYVSGPNINRAQEAIRILTFLNNGMDASGAKQDGFTLSFSAALEDAGLSRINTVLFATVNDAHIKTLSRFSHKTVPDKSPYYQPTGKITESSNQQEAAEKKESAATAEKAERRSAYEKSRTDFAKEYVSSNPDATAEDILNAWDAKTIVEQTEDKVKYNE